MRVVTIAFPDKHQENRTMADTPMKGDTLRLSGTEGLWIVESRVLSDTEILGKEPQALIVVHRADGS